MLRSWLAVRYSRTAFPDAFNRRMQSTGVDKRLDKTVASYGQLISSIYFILDGGQSVERTDGDSYELSIVLAHPPGDDAEASGEAATIAADATYEACSARLKDKSEIDLKACIAISEDDLPVSRARVMAQWRLEHVTLKADGAQPGPVPI